MKGQNNKFMGICKVGEKGQIVIPKEARDLFGIVPGDTVIVLCDKKKGMAVVKSTFFEGFANKIFDGGAIDESDRD